MSKHAIIHFPEFRHQGPALVLAAFFFLGHFLGVLLSGSASQHFFSAMRTAVSSRVSIIGLLSSVVLPFVFSAAAVYLGRPVLLFPIAFWKAFLFSYLGSGLCSAWGSAGWLMMPLVMFGSLCSMPVLYWYWMRSVAGHRFEIGVCCAIFGILLAVWAVDYYLIVPFLAGIITF
ncbi:MAG: hypothetical protein IJZ39_02620 [Oscillospiraceae bacterium]|nr:hypothetical protein [Oscillospiraceae bacterium]